MQDDDTFKLEYTFIARNPSDYCDQVDYRTTINATWNEIFAGVSPVLIDETSEYSLRQAFIEHFTRMAKEELADNDKLKSSTLGGFKFAKTQIGNRSRFL